jgi:chemotaxis protein CheX
MDDKPSKQCILVDMDVKIINPFLSATINLLEHTFGLTATNGTPFLLEDLVRHRWEVTGLIAITGSTRGVIALRMHHLLVDKLLAKSGLEVADEKERVELTTSMVSELINIISGNAIGNIEGYDLDISVPMVVQGKGHLISWPQIAPVVCIPFRTSAGDFEVSVCFKT